MNNNLLTMLAVIDDIAPNGLGSALPEALRSIQRFEVVDCIDSKHVPAVIPRPHGPWVRYEDHIAALAAGQATAAPAQPAAQQGAADGFFLLLPQRPKPEAPAGTVGLDWDAYSGAQMLAFGRDCSDAAIAALRTEQPAPATEEEEDEGVSREQWVEQAMRVYLIAGDTEDEARECAEYQWGELDMDDLADPYDTAMSDIEGRGPAPATQQAGEVRRAELVPGVMHCAKCKFQLNRVTLCVSDGNAYAGNNKTEPCPNGCGPLWPVTWEQEAKNCWKALEEMHERLMAAAAPQPSPTAQAAESVQEDAALWHWLAEYLVGTRTDLDDEIVASETVNDLRKLVKAASKQGAPNDR